MSTAPQTPGKVNILMATIMAFCITNIIAIAADDPKKPAKETKSAAGKLQLKGVFESTSSHPIKVDFKAWTAPVIEEAVKPGARVARGQTLIRFKTDEIDKKIAATEKEVVTSRIALDKSRLELELAQANLPAELAASRTGLDNANTDMQRFISEGRPLQEKSSRWRVKQSEFMLDYAREELRQLEKMYKEDELTEETEEIILTRTRRGVAMAEFSLDQSRIASKEMLGITLPRKQKEMEEALRKARGAWKTAMETLPDEIKTKKVETAKLEVALRDKEKTLQKLVADRKKMIVRSPIAGLVYAGAPVAGKWADATADAKLASGLKATAGATLMTVVDPGKLSVLLAVPEKNLSQVLQAKTCTVVPVGFPGMSLPGTVGKTSLTPGAGGCFQGQVTLKVTDHSTTQLRPGMTCTVTLDADNAKD